MSDAERRNVTLTDEAIQSQWDDFTAEEIDWIDCNPRNLIEAVATKYGLSQDEAARQVNDFLTNPNSAKTPPMAP